MPATAFAPYVMPYSHCVAAMLDAPAAAPPAASAPILSGGTATISSGYVYHTITANDVIRVWQAGSSAVDWMLVGGGAAGGFWGGGGGGGKVLTGTGVTLAVGAYPVVIGAGGTPSADINTKGGNGGASTFNGNSATGGGGGGSQNNRPGAAGGNGGGGAYDSAGTGGVGEQFNGGAASSGQGTGGGGGASAAGGNASGNTGGNGGAGYLWLDGNRYGGGGGGSARSDDPSPVAGTGGAGGGGNGGNAAAGSAGTANTGGGGGGGGRSSSGPTNFAGGAGGSGVFKLRYPTTELLAGQYATGGTIAVNGNNIEHTFSAGGTFALSMKGMLPVTVTISGTGTFGVLSASGSATVTGNVTVTVTSGTVKVSYPPGAFEPGNPLGWGTNAQGYWNPDLNVTDAGAGAVSQWNDQSANACHYLQATGANRPTTGTQTTPIGGNAIDFDGSNDYMDGNANILDMSGKKTTFFGVIKWDAAGTGKCVIQNMRVGGTLGLSVFMFEVNTVNPQLVFGTGDNGFSGGVFNERVFNPGTVTNWHRFILTIDSTDTWHTYVDGVEISTSGGGGGGSCPAANYLANNSSAWKPTVGRRADPFYFDGKVAHHGYLNVVPNSTDRGLLDNWMKVKTGV